MKISTYVHRLQIELTASDIFIKTRTERTVNKGLSTFEYTQIYRKPIFILHIVICKSGALYHGRGSGSSNSFYMVFALFMCQVNALYCNLP